MGKTDIRATLQQLPERPGVYSMLDSRDHVIYVGKAKNLKNRVSQYFRSQKDRDPKIAEMVSGIAAVTWTVTDTELDALVEECRLIREIKPRYNSKMKNTKGYVYIKAPLEPFPKLVVVTEKVDDGAEYFGPFANAYRVELALGYLNDYFVLRKCSSQALVKKANGCLYWQIGSCLGACRGTVGTDEYRVKIDGFKSFLAGKDMGAMEVFKEKLDRTIESLDFEKAALYYEYLIGLEHMVRRQRLAQSSNLQRNILAVHLLDNGSIKFFFIKGNRLLHRELVDVSVVLRDDFGTVLARMVTNAFSSVDGIPELTQNDIDEAQIIYSYLRRNKDRIQAFWIPSSRLKVRLGLDGSVSSIIERVVAKIGS